MISNEGREYCRGIGLLAEHIICMADLFDEPIEKFRKSLYYSPEFEDKGKIIQDNIDTANRIRDEANLISIDDLEALYGEHGIAIVEYVDMLANAVRADPYDNNEVKFNFYHNRKDNFYSNKVERETAGLVGYIRGDFGSGGNGFHHTWFENKEKLNNEVFKEDLNKVMDFLRERMLTDRMYTRSAVYGNPNAKIDSKESTSYGVFVDTDGYEYDIRAICDDGNYDFYIYCYDKRFQKPQFLNNRRFRDEHGKLNETVEEIAKKTLPEARNYYINGDKYENNGKIYTFRASEENMYFEDKDGEKFFVAPEMMGTFLPEVATEGNSFVKVPLSQTQSSITLGELIKMVKLSSVHLVHDEVDIELATIEDLSDSMFTEEGRAAWRDVLNAKVVKDKIEIPTLYKSASF